MLTISVVESSRYSCMRRSKPDRPARARTATGGRATTGRRRVALLASCSEHPLPVRAKSEAVTIAVAATEVTVGLGRTYQPVPETERSHLVPDRVGRLDRDGI